MLCIVILHVQFDKQNDISGLQDCRRMHVCLMVMQKWWSLFTLMQLLLAEKLKSQWKNIVCFLKEASSLLWANLWIGRQIIDELLFKNH